MSDAVHQQEDTIINNISGMINNQMEITIDKI